MKHKAAGTAKGSKTGPRHVEKAARGTEKNPFSKTATKADLLARMKAAAAGRKGTS